ncbi:ADP-ribosylation factor 1-like isoform X2 [Physella acuta]|uniref:ADP-ribosylation factor 1-like isoform X2 n=1 Tax=Physella acuta TaxID=109671 RepID=UPI0027DB2785|nr:ADP-ribosylation factor 1-like isoform X2 [Physella acuta]
MGALFSFSKDHDRIVIACLDPWCKTSQLFKLKLGEVVTTIPPFGFNFQKLNLNEAIDICGRDKMRPLSRDFYANTDGVIYMIDSNNRERLDDAIDELMQKFLTPYDLIDTVVMVLANNQDLPNALSSQEIEDRLKEKCPRCRQTIFVLPCSVTTKVGVHEAFDEFVKQIKLMKAGKAKRSYIDVHKSMEEDCSKGGNSLNSIRPGYFKSYLSYFKQILSNKKQKNNSVKMSAGRSAEPVDTVTSSNTGDSQQMVSTDTQLTNVQQVDLQPTDQSQPVLDSHSKSADLQ